MPSAFSKHEQATSHRKIREASGALTAEMDALRAIVEGTAHSTGEEFFRTLVRQTFPDDKLLIDWGIESYLGVPLRDPQGNVLGHLAVFDERPMPEEPRKLLIFHIFAARAAAELSRLRLEWELRRKDNGKPVWVDWRSKPDPGGKFIRTMFVDITDRVLAEQERARLAAQNLYLQEEIKSADEIARLMLDFLDRHVVAG